MLWSPEAKARLLRDIPNELGRCESTDRGASLAGCVQIRGHEGKDSVRAA
jgi:hypothetical protein